MRARTEKLTRGCAAFFRSSFWLWMLVTCTAGDQGTNFPLAAAACRAHHLGNGSHPQVADRFGRRLEVQGASPPPIVSSTGTRHAPAHRFLVTMVKHSQCGASLATLRLKTDVFLPLSNMVTSDSLQQRTLFACPGANARRRT